MNEKKYQYYMYLAGKQVPLIGCVINSQLGSVAQLSITLNYSPYITQIYEFTKIQIFEQLINNGSVNEPTLEFDGVVLSITRSKNILGSVRCMLVCATDGIIWNRRKQYDLYLNDIMSNQSVASGADLKVRADGQITNFFAETLSKNDFDIGCAAASVLTSYLYGLKSDYSDASQKDVSEVNKVSYQGHTYIYNGRYIGTKELGGENLTPKYYMKFLEDNKLGNKLYGVATSQKIKEYFQADRITKLLNNTVQDLQGENSFWTIALQVMNYGFYNVYDIPNPTFIEADKLAVVPKGGIPSDRLIIGEQLQETKINTSGDGVGEVAPDSSNTLGAYQDKLKATGEKQAHGLAEYIMRPISIFGIPLKCNIVWPDQILEENITYDFFNAPTRVIMASSPIMTPDATYNILTSQTFAGPVYNTTTDEYLTSFMPEKTKFKPGEGNNTVRPDQYYSPAELEYGINYHRLQLSYAFDRALLQKTVQTAQDNAEEQAQQENAPGDNQIARKVNNIKETEDDKNSATLVNNFLNYEFAQKFFGTRSFNVQVTPDVNVVAGLPIILLNKIGQHIIAFCTGVRKSWDQAGTKFMVLTVAYPRYYYEDIGSLGNVVDPSSKDATSIAEIELLFGSKCLNGIVSEQKDGDVTIDNTSTNLEKLISDIYKDFLSSENPETIKKEYTRKSCTFAEFMKLHGIENIADSKKLPNQYDKNLFASQESEDKLSHRYFAVTDEQGKVQKYNGKDGQAITLHGIIDKHLEWISTGRRI